MERETMIPKASLASVFYISFLLALSVFIITYFEDLFKPLLIAFLLWFIIKHLQISIRKVKFTGRTLSPFTSNLLAYFIILAVFYVTSRFLLINIEGILASMPQYLENLNNKFGYALKLIESPKYQAYLQKLISGLDIESMVKHVAGAITSLLTNISVISIYLIFFIMEEKLQKVKIDKLFPGKGKHYQKFIHNIESIAKSIRYYITSMTIISFLTAAVSFVILILMHVEYAFLWSFIIFILNFIPYIGPLISSLLPALFAFLVTGDPMKIIWVFIAMEGVQVVFGNFVQPMMMGKGTNLSTVVVLVALAFWGMIWGVVGMILAIPLTSVAVIILGQIPSTQFIAIMLSEKGEIGEMEN